MSLAPSGYPERMSQCTAPVKGHVRGSAEERNCPACSRRSTSGARTALAAPTLGAGDVGAIDNADTPVMSHAYMGGETGDIEEWRRPSDNKLHREDGPARVCHYRSGYVSQEEWFENGARHRVGAPSVLGYNYDHQTGKRTINRESWEVNGLRHRDGDLPAETSWHPNGALSIEAWCSGGKAHRVGGPAVISWRRNGAGMEYERWMQDGLVHREDGPAERYFHPDGTVRSEKWSRHGKIHREDGPAETVYNLDGSVSAEYWRMDDKLHREDAPAMVEYHPNGAVKREVWYRHDMTHRDSVDEPAARGYNDDGSVSSEAWYVNDKLHRVGGPAETVYERDGSVADQSWMQHGKKTPYWLVRWNAAQSLGVKIHKSNAAAFAFLGSTPIDQWDHELVALALDLNPNP